LRLTVLELKALSEKQGFFVSPSSRLGTPIEAPLSAKIATLPFFLYSISKIHI